MHYGYMYILASLIVSFCPLCPFAGQRHLCFGYSSDIYLSLAFACKFLAIMLVSLRNNPVYKTSLICYEIKKVMSTHISTTLWFKFINPPKECYSRFPLKHSITPTMLIPFKRLSNSENKLQNDRTLNPGKNRNPVHVGDEARKQMADAPTTRSPKQGYTPGNIIPI